MKEILNASQIRAKYLEFMRRHGHVTIEPAPLVLTDDPTTLFTSSGMQPLMPYLLGQQHPHGERLANSQPCLRTQDVDDVGNNRHTTCFEMLGNWSLGDYFKEEQIRMFFEFLTGELGLAPEKLYVSCFIGDEKLGIPRDDESAEIWRKIFAGVEIEAKIAEIGSSANGAKRGMKKDERIFFYDDKENWWSRGGGIDSTPIGDPCGPDSEVFYDFGEEMHDESFGRAHPAGDSGRFMEIGNQVFMQYKRLENGQSEPLKNKNVDFGGGLERLAAAAAGTPDIFKTSLYAPIIQELEVLSGKKYDSNQAAMRVIADHLKGAVFLAVGGLTPSNKEQGYVMRRLIRRATMQALDLGIEEGFSNQLVKVIIDIYKGDYEKFGAVGEKVATVLQREEEMFRATLGRGLRELDKLAKYKPQLEGKDVFKLQDTYGFPRELAAEEIFRRGYKLSENWTDEFETELRRQRERSQTAAKGTFKGGLEGDAEIHKKYHTATHLLGAALDKVLGVHVAQRGSHINDERLRLDFSYSDKLTGEQVAEVERVVNEAIAADYAVSFDEYDTDFALDELHATGEFRDKYGDKVLVYVIGELEKPFSVDVCGGPHVEHTGQLAEGGKKFRIVKEQSSSAGVRRIKAVLE
ncbi:MAG: alanine--tRNA ligase [Candidatus Nomurabacteria bacterium]|jgi:alanyl-tRNA synthetase|nr:alanine--tRNA ligase [Candidatus Nomurabacteria bacterium]